MNFESQPPNFTPSFYAYSFEFWHILHLVLMAALSITKIGNPITLFLIEILEKLETFSSGLGRQHSLVITRT
jgi:uncharacterized membrane protein (UPF0182 family)